MRTHNSTYSKHQTNIFLIFQSFTNFTIYISHYTIFQQFYNPYTSYCNFLIFSQTHYSSTWSFKAKLLYHQVCPNGCGLSKLLWLVSNQGCGSNSIDDKEILFIRKLLVYLNLLLSYWGRASLKNMLRQNLYEKRWAKTYGWLDRTGLAFR